MLTKAKRTIRLLWPEFKLPLQLHCKDYLFNFVYRGLVASWDKMVIRQCKAMGWAKETACDCRGCLLRSLNHQNICFTVPTQLPIYVEFCQCFICPCPMTPGNVAEISCVSLTGYWTHCVHQRNQMTSKTPAISVILPFWNTIFTRTNILELISAC